jgi:hypothetical protein
VTLTRAQLRVLYMLDERPRETSNVTKHRRVSGAVVAALIRRGLVERAIPWWDGEGEQPPVRRVYITAAGRKALLKPVLIS